jgi:hypothetical protein
MYLNTHKYINYYNMTDQFAEYFYTSECGSLRLKKNYQLYDPVTRKLYTYEQCEYMSKKKEGKEIKNRCWVYLDDNALTLLENYFPKEKTEEKEHKKPYLSTEVHTAWTQSSAARMKPDEVKYNAHYIPQQPLPGSDCFNWPLFAVNF